MLPPSWPCTVIHREDATPSEADIKVTRDLIRAGQLLKIELA
jgi:DNA repair protein RadC